MKKFILTILVLCTALTLFASCIPDEVTTDSTIRPLRVHFIDVGQASCQLLELPNGENMLIDAGNNDDSGLIVEYLTDLDIEKIHYLVATHPHEDHIGSLDTVINNFEIGTLYMPDAEADTKTYRDVISAVEENDVFTRITGAGEIIYNDSALKIVTVAPVKKYEDLNNSGIVVHLTYKKSTFLFTGDIEEESENDITSNIEADVLAVSHHGSSSSTSDYFLKRVDPMYAVISCGKGNSYGHPHREVIERLKNDDVTIYRTDESGTLICTTTGGGPADYKWEVE